MIDQYSTGLVIWSQNLHTGISFHYRFGKQISSFGSFTSET